MRDHERIEELIAARALGGLDPADAATLRTLVSAHGSSCDECARLETEYAEVAGRLAFALDPAPIRPGLEDETVGLALAGQTQRSLPPTDEPARPRRSIGARLRPLVAIAAALVLFAGGWVLGTRTSGEGPPQVPPDATVVPFQGEPGSGTLAVAYTPSGSGVYLLGSDLPAPPEGTVYQFWMIQGTTPVAGPCLSPSADGSLFAFVDTELGGTDAMAVTVEPSTCSSAPTTTPIYVADLTTA